MATESSTDIAANKRVIQQYFSCMGRNDIDGALGLLTDDAEWWVPGNWELSGTFTKAQMSAMLKHELPFQGPLQYDVRGVTAEGDRVAVELATHGTLKDGRSYDNTYHFMFRLKGGRIVRVNEYVDTLYSYRTFFAAPTS